MQYNVGLEPWKLNDFSGAPYTVSEGSPECKRRDCTMTWEINYDWSHDSTESVIETELVFENRDGQPVPVDLNIESLFGPLVECTDDQREDIILGAAPLLDNVEDVLLKCDT